LRSSHFPQDAKTLSNQAAIPHPSHCPDGPSVTLSLYRKIIMALKSIYLLHHLYRHGLHTGCIARRWLLLHKDQVKACSYWYYLISIATSRLDRNTPSIQIWLLHSPLVSLTQRSAASISLIPTISRFFLTSNHPFLQSCMRPPPPFSPTLHLILDIIHMNYPPSHHRLGLTWRQHARLTPPQRRILRLPPHKLWQVDPVIHRVRDDIAFARETAC
jgi:hypothetical protein